MKTIEFKEIKQLTQRGNYTIDIDLGALSDHIERYKKIHGLDMNVDFQRGHVWTKEQQRAFVEFILRGGQTSALLFNHANWMHSFEGNMVLVDGKQRITALLNFINNELDVFGGYKFNQIKGIPLHNMSLKIRVNNLKHRKEVLQWYIELNTGGTPHTDAEILKVKKLLNKL